MPSVTLLHRLEPLPHADDPAIPAARTADPMWLLFRQRQMGELRGTDGGSPVWAEVHVQVERLSRFQPGSGTAVPYDPDASPLEAMVERLAFDPAALDLREANALASRLIDAVDHTTGKGAAYRTHWQRSHGFDRIADDELAALPARERAMLRLLLRTGIDGRRLYADATTGRDLPLLDPSHATDVRTAITQWLDSLPGAHTPSWQPYRLEHRFAVAANGPHGETVLRADEYAGGHLDWPTFDVSPGSLDAGADPVPAATVHHAIPTPIQLPGTPSPRWWEIEDRQVNWAAMSSSLTELGRLLLLEYTLVHGTDWHSIAVPVPLGSLVGLTTVRITDAFGETVDITPTADAGPTFRAFELTGDAHNRLLVAPSRVGDAAERTVEAVRFARDPGANVAWAIERLAPGPGGLPTDRYEAWQRDAVPAPDPTPVAGDRRFVPLTEVPPHWYPLLRTGQSLRRGRVVHRANAAQPLPWGHILNARTPLDLAESEVPRAGVEVTRSIQRVRWLSGSVHQWTGHTKRTSEGEGWSNLQYDTLHG